MKRFVLIGCGNWGGWWVRHFIPETADVAQCVAVVDVNRAASERAGAALGLPLSACYTDTVQALRENPVDYAVVAASIPHHLEVFRAILETRPGCPILSEKPIAGSWAECLEIQRLVHEADIHCAFTLSHRYEQDKQTLQSVLQSEKYGKINTIAGRLIVQKQQPARLPEMTLIDGGVHYLDMLRPFSSSEAKTVYAQAWDCPWENSGHAASAFVQAEMQNGVRATMEYLLGGAENRNSWCDEYFRVECEKASLVLDHRALIARWTDASGALQTENIPLVAGNHWKHDRIIRDFIAWLDGGPKLDLCLEESMKAMALLYSAVESAQTGQAVSVLDRLRQCEE